MWAVMYDVTGWLLHLFLACHSGTLHIRDIYKYIRYCSIYLYVISDSLQFSFYNWVNVCLFVL